MHYQFLSVYIDSDIRRQEREAERWEFGVFLGVVVGGVVVEEVRELCSVN